MLSAFNTYNKSFPCIRCAVQDWHWHSQWVHVCTSKCMYVISKTREHGTCMQNKAVVFRWVVILVDDFGWRWFRIPWFESKSCENNARQRWVLQPSSSTTLSRSTPGNNTNSSACANVAARTRTRRRCCNGRCNQEAVIPTVQRRNRSDGAVSLQKTFRINAAFYCRRPKNCDVRRVMAEMLWKKGRTVKS